MSIIKDQQICENNWHYIADEMVPINGNITVSADRWHNDKALLLQHSGMIGIRLTPNDAIESIADDLPKVALIELYFSVFTDGRSFSQARLLRNRYGYQGEIRAVGNFMTDQVFYLHRVGVNAFELSQARDIELALSALKDFSVSYQVSCN